MPKLLVIDESTTELFRNGTPKTEDDFIKQEAEYCRKTFEPQIKTILKIAETMYENLCKSGGSVSKKGCVQSEHIPDCFKDGKACF